MPILSRFQRLKYVYPLFYSGSFLSKSYFNFNICFISHIREQQQSGDPEAGPSHRRVRGGSEEDSADSEDGDDDRMSRHRRRIHEPEVLSDGGAEDMDQDEDGNKGQEDMDT